MINNNSNKLKQYLSGLNTWMNKLGAKVYKNKKHFCCKRKFRFFNAKEINFFSSTKRPLNDFALALSQDLIAGQPKKKKVIPLNLFILDSNSFMPKQPAYFKKAMWFYKDLADKKLSCRIFTSFPLLSYFLFSKNKLLGFMGPDGSIYIVHYHFKYLWAYVDFIKFCLSEKNDDKAKKLILHAATIAKNRGLVLIVGKSGAGKSTLAKKLSSQKFIIINDDAAYLQKKGKDFRYCFSEYFLKNIRQFIPEAKHSRNEYESFQVCRSYLESKVTLVLFLERAKSYLSRIEEVENSAAVVKKLFQEHSVAISRKEDMAEKLKLLLCLLNGVKLYRILSGKDIFTKKGAAELAAKVNTLL